jgi:8-oxo-dGTP pyrophosphatase MutT (NUDIX family)/predicted alpha/beta hydrolase family esterase
MSALHQVHPGKDKQVIFIHGVDGHWQSTWTSRDSAQVSQMFWPEQLGKDTGWDTASLEYDVATKWFGHTMALNERAKNLLEIIEAQEPDDARDLCIVAHSFGGIVAKRMVLLAGEEPHWRRFLDRLIGIVFLGTPHLGSRMANLLSRVPGSTRTVEELRFGNDTLSSLNESFRRIYPELGLKVLALAESKRYKVGMFRTGRVVETVSADPALFGVSVISVDSDHHEIACPGSTGAEQYTMVLKFLRSCFELPHALAKLPAQAAAACYRIRGNSLEFLLVRTTGGRWTFPKGGIEAGEMPHKAAEREAQEEAGAIGTISALPLGAYLHVKREFEPTGGHQFAVWLFPLEVTGQLKPESDKRTPTWFSAEEAKTHLSEDRDARYSREMHRMIDLGVQQLAPKARASASEK